MRKLLAGLFLLVTLSALAKSHRPKTQDYLIGFPGGWRDRLADKGFTISTDYLQYVLGNPVGAKRGIVHTEQFSADFNWDLEKAYNVKGLELHLGILIVSGKNLEPKINTEFPLTLLYGGRTFLINNLYLKQTALNGDLVFKAGRIQAGDDFLSSPLHLKFLSLAFDAQIAMYINTPASGYPYATWGAYLSTTSNYMRLNLGVYSADQDAYKNKYHGLDLSFDAKGGAELIAESVYLVNQQPTSKGLPTTYKLGVFYFTGTQSRFFSDDKNGNYGAYLSLDQKLYQSAHNPRELSSFLTFLFFPKDRNKFPFYTTGGLVYQGLFHSRPKDTTAIAVAIGTYSSDLRKLQRNAAAVGVPGVYGNQPQTYETLIELNHWFQIRPWFNLTPAAQYLPNPKGLGGKGVIVLCLQTNIFF